jgi:hypothetical protein
MFESQTSHVVLWHQHAFVMVYQTQRTRQIQWSSALKKVLLRCCRGYLQRERLPNPLLSRISGVEGGKGLICLLVRQPYAWS